MYVYIYIYMYMSICIYTYIYDIHIYICIYTCICIYKMHIHISHTLVVTNALSVCVPSSVGAGSASLPERAQLDVAAIVAEALGSLRFGGAAAARRTVQMGDIQCNAKRSAPWAGKSGEGPRVKHALDGLPPLPLLSTCHV